MAAKFDQFDRTKTVTLVNDNSSRVFASTGLTSSSNSDDYVILLFSERPINCSNQSFGGTRRKIPLKEVWLNFGNF